jgi:hypothetical protein
MQPLAYYTPPARPILPGRLRVVAWLFIIGGLLCVGDMIYGLARGRAMINISVIGVFIGRGLLQLRSNWRTCAVVFLWVGMLAGAAIVAAPFITDEPLTMHLGVRGWELEGDRARLVGLAVGFPLFCVSLWQKTVLRRPEIRALFDNQADPPREPEPPPPTGPRIDPLA